MARAKAPQSHASVEYVTTVAHALMTPLSGIVLWCELLKERGPISDVVSRGLLAIDRSAHAQAAIIDNLVELSQLQAGATELERSTVAVAECVEDALKRCRSAAEQRHVRLDFAAPSRALEVRGDPQRLRTALYNVFDNAINASSDGGRVEVAVEPAPEGASITVTDEGAGVAPEALPLLLTVHDLVGRARHHGRRGLGLGLPIARWIVERHGGTMAAENVAPRGFRVAITLPAA